jgi:hypothetical protein
MSANLIPLAFAPLVPSARIEAWRLQWRDRRCATMADAYARSGGLCLDIDVEGLLRMHTSQPLSVLARWIVERRLVMFVCEAQRWIPLFQFDRADMSLRPHVQRVVAELDSAFDEPKLAQWFAWPNSSLNGRAPVEIIERDPTTVLAAARIDRLAANG